MKPQVYGLIYSGTGHPAWALRRDGVVSKKGIHQISPVTVKPRVHGFILVVPVVRHGSYCKASVHGIIHGGAGNACMGVGYRRGGQ